MCSMIYIFRLINFVEDEVGSPHPTPTHHRKLGRVVYAHTHIHTVWHITESLVGLCTHTHTHTHTAWHITESLVDSELLLTCQS